MLAVSPSPVDIQRGLQSKMDLIPKIYGRISKFLFLLNKRKSGCTTKGIISIILYVIRI